MKKAKDGGGGGGGLRKGGDEEVSLRRKEVTTPAPSSFTPSPYNFMRRSCTFVAESSLGLRKSANRTSLTGQPPSLRPALKTNSTPAANKVVKDRKNLAMQVRQKKEQLEESVDGKHERSLQGGVNGGSGRMSRLVGGLRAWSSTEDVRQSFMGAIGRTVSVIKQRPGRRVKQAFGRPDPNKPETITANGTSKPGPAKPGVTKPSTNKSDLSKTETNRLSTRYNNARNAPNKNQLKTPSEKLSQTDKTQQQGKTAASGKTQLGKSASGRPKSSPASNQPLAPDATNSTSPGWFRHIQEAQEAYTARDGRNRRSHPPTSLPDPDDQPASSADVDDGVDIDGGDAADGSNDVLADSKVLHGASKNQDQTTKSEESSSTTTSTPTTGQPPSSPDTLSKKTEHLRRKDLKIRQALEEKQHIIADILNIPHEHFENVVDMAGEPTVGNKEPRELVLAAMFQAKCLQETLNEALNIGEGDIVAARATNDGANKGSSNLPLYQAPMTKLMTISTSLSQQLASLLNLISERDDERERMRKELVASRERLHLFHMRQNSNQPTTTTTSTSVGVTPPVATSPHTSRPSSFVSVASSTADHSDTPDHHDTDEESRNEVPKVNSLHPTECEDSKEDVVPETFEDAVSGGEQTEATSRETEGSLAVGQEECNEGIGSRESEGNTEVTTTT